MKIPTRAYSLDMNEYDVGVENFHGDKDLNEEDSDEYERDFCNGIDEGEILAEDDDGAEDDIFRQLAQKDKDLLLAAELGKALLEKNEELNQKYELLQEDYSQAVEELEQDKYELKLKVERLQDANDSRVHELQADLVTLRNELKTLQSNSNNDKQSKRETFCWTYGGEHTTAFRSSKGKDR
ncbi:coiled-coil domain containing protein 64 [Desmophyllum pertusum]|uniref:Coiled-coil domain containing protein 64 n=1 Tax=Desmophyllum pertusum TaxID=174260 RepID=A0A9W9ZWA3_9CNID|nr:coiled-coil domain containing protein 64 [Desmophyllum pertusum]